MPTRKDAPSDIELRLSKIEDSFTSIEKSLNTLVQGLVAMQLKVSELTGRFDARFGTPRLTCPNCGRSTNRVNASHCDWCGKPL